LATKRVEQTEGWGTMNWVEIGWKKITGRDNKRGKKKGRFLHNVQALQGENVISPL